MEMFILHGFILIRYLYNNGLNNSILNYFKTVFVFWTASGRDPRGQNTKSVQ